MCEGSLHFLCSLSLTKNQLCRKCSEKFGPYIDCIMISVYGQTNNCQKAISVDPEKTALVGEV